MNIRTFGTKHKDVVHTWRGTWPLEHLQLGAIAEEHGTGVFKPDAVNVKFHQLELQNLVNSGGALPKFFDGVTEEDISNFLEVEP